MAAMIGVWMIIAMSTVIHAVSADLSCRLIVNELQLKCNSTDKKEYVLKMISDVHLTDNLQGIDQLSVHLKGCFLTDIELRSFENLYAMSYLDLSENKIRRLKLGVFDELTQLQTLNLSYNMLTYIPPGLFDHNTKLLRLSFEKNMIKSSLSGVIDKLTKLEQLDLQYNHILGSDSRPTSPNQCTETKLIDLSRESESDNVPNEFRNQLITLSYQVCNIPEASLRKKKHISFFAPRKRRESSSIFDELHNLQSLVLTHNSIESVHVDIFKGLHEVRILQLNNNLLNSIPETLFRNCINLLYLNLSHNLIEHVAANTFMGTSLSYLNLSHNRFTYLADSFFLNLRNSGARLEEVWFNHNPWQCACLLQVVTEVNSLGLAYNGYNGTEPVCVTTTPFSCRRSLEINQLYVEMYDNLITGG